MRRILWILWFRARLLTEQKVHDTARAFLFSITVEHVLDT
jgi:hypothetical protein